jgi:hypothetical protein
MISARLAERLDALALEVIQYYHGARMQLEEWAGDYKSHTIGASPPSADPPLSDEQQDARDRQAVRPDDAQRTLDRMRFTLDYCATTGREIWADFDGVSIPTPADSDAARLAVMMWAARRAARDRQNAPAAIIGSFDRHLTMLHGICARYQPPKVPERFVDICHAHEAAGLEAGIEYRRLHLCRWCGDFRALHGVNPPPKLVRLHDRGISMSTSLLRSAGIRTGQPRTPREEVSP